MNRHLEQALFDIEKAEAVMSAIEELYVSEADGMEVPLFYVLSDTIRKVSADLELLKGDCDVVGAIREISTKQ